MTADALHAARLLARSLAECQPSITLPLHQWEQAHLRRVAALLAWAQTEQEEEQ